MARAFTLSEYIPVIAIIVALFIFWWIVASIGRGNRVTHRYIKPEEDWPGEGGPSCSNDGEHDGEHDDDSWF